MTSSSSVNSTEAGSHGAWSTNGTTEQATQLPATTGSSDATVNSIQAAYTLLVIYLTIGSFGFVSNLLVVAVIAVYKPMHKQMTNVYIANQSLIDSTVALFLFFTTLFPDDLKLKTPGNVSDEMLCRLWYTKLPLWSMLVSSTYGILTLSFERFLAVVFPIWHKTKFNRKFMIVTVVITWLIGPTYQLSNMIATAAILPSGQCTVYSIYPNATAKQTLGWFNILIQFIIPLILMAIFYGKMAIALHNRVEAAEPTVPGKEVKRNESMARARSNVIKTLALVSFFFIFCWSWNQIYYLMYNLGYYLDYTSAFYNFTVIMVFVNCCVNPVIYSVKYEPFQRGVAWILCRNRVSTAPADETNGPATNHTP